VRACASYEYRMSVEWTFETLVDRYYGALYRFALSLTRHESDAADLTQQTFQIWALKGHQLRDQSKAKTWLFTTLHRQFLESHRKTTRFPQCELNEVDHDLPSVAPAPVHALDADTLLDALGRIEPAYQAAVALFYLEDHSYPEIASILNVPLGTVKSRISRGIAQLQRRLLESPRPLRL
jgi:RNA polymerase sigma-70 factor, ECF subfamily